LPDPPPFPEDDFPFDNLSDGTLSIIDTGGEQLGYTPASLFERRFAASTVQGHSEFSPEPLPLPFYPVINAPKQTGKLAGRRCQTNPEVHVMFPGRTSMSVLATCPWRVVKSVPLGFR